MEPPVLTLLSLSLLFAGLFDYLLPLLSDRLYATPNSWSVPSAFYLVIRVFYSQSVAAIMIHAASAPLVNCAALITNAPRATAAQWICLFVMCCIV